MILAYLTIVLQTLYQVIYREFYGLQFGKKINSITVKITELCAVK